MRSNGNFKLNEDQASPSSSQNHTVAVITTTDDSSQKQRRLANLFYSIAAVVVAGTIFWVTFQLATKYTDQSDKVNDLAAQNVELQDQNAELLESIDSLREDQEEETRIDACYDSYTANITEASAANSTGGTGQSVNLIIAYLLSESPEGQANPYLDDLAKQVGDTEQLINRYNEAVASRREWVDAGKPMPCPVSGVIVPEAAPEN